MYNSLVVPVLQYHVHHQWVPHRHQYSTTTTSAAAAAVEAACDGNYCDSHWGPYRVIHQTYIKTRRVPCVDLRIVDLVRRCTYIYIYIYIYNGALSYIVYYSQEPQSFCRVSRDFTRPPSSPSSCRDCSTLVFHQQVAKPRWRHPLLRQKLTIKVGYVIESR